MGRPQVRAACLQQGRVQCLEEGRCVLCFFKEAMSVMPWGAVSKSTTGQRPHAGDAPRLELVVMVVLMMLVMMPGAR